MKSYEEMTVSVLARGRKERQAQRKKRGIALATIAGFCCLCLSVVGVQWLKASAGQTPVQTLQQPRIGFAIRCSAAEAKPAELIKDVITPCEMMLRVRNVTGMDEAQRNTIQLQEKQFATEIFENWDERTANSFIQWGSETAIISLFWVGELELVVDNYDEVERASIVATEMGLSSLGYVDSYEGDDKLSVFLGLSDKAIQIIEDNPDAALSTFSYSLSVKVKFKDGTTETAIIDIIIDDDGYMYARQKSIVVTA